MDPIATLLTIAQIGVTVAGFASLASVVGQTRTSTDPQVNAIRLRGLLNTSLAAMLLALVAVLLLAIPALGSWAWRGASIVGLLCAVPIGWGALKRDRPRRALPGYNKPVAQTNYAILGAVVFALAFNGAGLAAPYEMPVFLATLILMLVGCSILFILVVVSLLEPAVDSRPPSSEE